MRTPDDVLTEIRKTRAELERGSSALYAAELNAERCKEAAQLALDKALLTADGSIPEKQALSRIASVAERDVAFIARAEYNRIRSKISELDSLLMSLHGELKWLREVGA